MKVATTVPDEKIYTKVNIFTFLKMFADSAVPIFSCKQNFYVLLFNNIGLNSFVNWTFFVVKYVTDKFCMRSLQKINLPWSHR